MIVLGIYDSQQTIEYSSCEWVLEMNVEVAIVVPSNQLFEGRARRDYESCFIIVIMIFNYY